MGRSVAEQLIESHLVSGEMTPGTEIALSIDQTLTQDATGTMVMLELEAMGLDRVRTELSVQYVDHNLLQTDSKNPDDHLFLRSACHRFGLWFSRPGNGVSHPVHMQRFGVPGKSMAGSDSHTCAAGSLGMLAVGVGGLEVAMAMAGEPLYLQMPQIWGIELTGELPAWVSAKDVILELLRRHGVKGGVNRILEYHGDGLAQLSAMDRHVIANMGAELGATTSVFPADDAVRAFMRAEEREDDFVSVLAEPGASYDVTDTIDLSTLEPLIATPSSPGNVVPVREVAGADVFQVVVGSSANPGLRDFAIVAEILRGRQSHEQVSVDVNPTSRQILQDLTTGGWLFDLIAAGARIHQSGCMGCIGMGQAPATGRNSLRTVPRNFPGRSGTDEDAVWLCSPETAAAAALAGTITDPRELPDLLGVGYPVLELPGTTHVNIPAISKFVFTQLDPDYAQRVAELDRPHVIVAGENYGQGSSREHAVIAPRYLGLRVVLAKSFARIHWQNLANFGILALRFAEPDDYDRINQGDTLRLDGLRSNLKSGDRIEVRTAEDTALRLDHDLSGRQIAMVLAAGRIRYAATERNEGGTDTESSERKEPR